MAARRCGRAGRSVFSPAAASLPTPGSRGACWAGATYIPIGLGCPRSGCSLPLGRIRLEGPEGPRWCWGAGGTAWLGTSALLGTSGEGNGALGTERGNVGQFAIGELRNSFP